MKRLFVLITSMLFFAVSNIGQAQTQVPAVIDSSFPSVVQQLNVDVINSNLIYFTATTNNNNKLQQYGTVVLHTGINRISLGSSLQCVEFVQLVSDAGWTGNWRKGNAITALTPQYSIVATFTATTELGPNTGYGNDQYSHVGVYIGRDSGGIYLIDQNHDGTGSSPVGRIKLHYISNSGSHQSNSANYYVVDKKL